MDSISDLTGAFRQCLAEPWSKPADPRDAWLCSGLTLMPQTGEDPLKPPALHCLVSASFPVGAHQQGEMLSTPQQRCSAEMLSTPQPCSQPVFIPSPPSPDILSQRLIFPPYIRDPQHFDPILTSASRHCCIAINIDANNEQLSDNYRLKLMQAKPPVIPCQ